MGEGGREEVIMTYESMLITGVIPRAVRQIFNGIEERKVAATERNEPQPQFELTAQFLEVGGKMEVS